MLMGKSYTMLLSQIPEVDERISAAQPPRLLMQNVRTAKPRKGERTMHNGRFAPVVHRPLPGECRRHEQCLYIAREHLLWGK